MDRLATIAQTPPTGLAAAGWAHQSPTLKDGLSPSVMPFLGASFGVGVSEVKHAEK